MRMRPSTLAMLASLVLFAPMASAEPSPEYECLFGYNPAALLNICHNLTDPGPAVGAGTVGTTPVVICPIGNICAPPLPVPTYDPNGPPTPVPQPGGLYLEVRGIPVEITYEGADELIVGIVQQELEYCASNGDTAAIACAAAYDILFGGSTP